MYVCMYACMYVCMYVCAYVCINIPSLFVCLWIKSIFFLIQHRVCVCVRVCVVCGVVWFWRRHDDCHYRGLSIVCVSECECVCVCVCV